ncbi:MAG TPA: Rne/Rng family ribonuclease [Armatimonadota bacterium]|jgi:ribonuclease G
MTKEIIINAGEMESRVAIMENGRLMELHIEREPKIVGNIYRGRVTKVLKGMDAAFVDIGIERNAFLAASDVIPDVDEEQGHGRISRTNIPPITQLLHNNQEILAQVVRAPMGTKGARITTRLSLPGRYMVLMLNSGAYVGVSRKIEDPKERQRLRALATELRPESYSLIVRTEAEGKTEEELRQDITFLIDMARRIEAKASSSPVPSLVHGDLTLIFRVIRDAFTRDVNRLVVDSPTTYENVLEMVGMLAPRMKSRVFLYNEPMPIFHAFNIEPEIERTLRRKVWLPSGGSLIIDQAEALTAIDVNTGRFVGSIELAETVLTTNLQAAEEAARQLRLRDLGGIIVVDFIDMDNPKHRQQVMKAFDEALKRDRAKIKVHSISSLGLVEMTRKRTGDSLVRLLTEPCPYCSGIGRVQNALTMALRIERELAASSVEHPGTEAYMLTAHPRVIASMLGYEGEAQRDLEAYLERPVYLRTEEDCHPNTYRLERLTLEQALLAVQLLEEGEVVEGQVVNPDPEVSLSPLVLAKDQYVVVPDLDAPVGARVKLRIQKTGTSLAMAEPLSVELRGIRTDGKTIAMQRPPLVPESILPPYLRDERSMTPPSGLSLLSPTAEAAMAVNEEEEAAIAVTPAAAEPAPGRRQNTRRRKRGGAQEAPRVEEATPVEETVVPSAIEAVAPEETVAEQAGEPGEVQLTAASARRRRRRRRGRGGSTRVAEGTTEETAVSGTEETVTSTTELPPVEETPSSEAPATAEGATRRRRNSRRRRESTQTAPEHANLSLLPVQEPVLEVITPEEAAQAMLGFLQAIPTETAPETATPLVEEAAPVTETPAEEPKPKPRRASRRRTPRVETPAEAPAEAPAEVVSEAAPAITEVEAPAPAAPEVAPETIAPAEEAPVAEVKPRRPRRTSTRRTTKAKASEEATPATEESPVEPGETTE